MVFDRKGEKDFDTRLDHPDIEDMFYVPYPIGRTGIPPGVVASKRARSRAQMHDPLVLANDCWQKTIAR
jgi:hypothetical protein